MPRRLLFALALVGAVLALSTPAAADPPRGSAVMCYVWANDATATLNTPYSPSPPYSYNALGRDAANTVTRTATGRYTVTCKGVGGGALAGVSAANETAEAELAAQVAEGAVGEIPPKAVSWGAGGHVQVTAYGLEDADQCKIGSWATGGADFTVTIGCFDHAGNPADQRFDMLFVW